MPSKAVVVAEQYDVMEKVVKLWMIGKDYKEISNELSITRAQVTEYIQGWKKFAANADISGRAKETLNQVDEHYKILISATHEALEEAILNGDMRNRLAAIKLIADMEGKRQQLYQAAGLSYDNETAKKIQKTEEQHEIIKDILQNHLCPDCKRRVADKLTELTGKVEAVRDDMPGGKNRNE